MRKRIFVAWAAALLLACDRYPHPGYLALALIGSSSMVRVSASISRLNGVSGLVLKNTVTGDVLSGVTANGIATFPIAFRAGGTFNIVVQSQPQGKTCTVSPSSGTAAANVTVTVSCPSNAYDIFVSAASASPNIGLAGMDAVCNADTNRTPTNTYKALLGASTRRACTTAGCSGGASEHLNWIMEPSTAYYRPGGATLIGTTSAAGIFVFPISNGWTGGALHWTGLNGNWTLSSTCLDWTSLNPADFAMQGNPNDATSAALDAYGLIDCGNTWPSIVCVAQ